MKWDVVEPFGKRLGEFLTITSPDVVMQGGIEQSERYALVWFVDGYGQPRARSVDSVILIQTG